MRVERRTARKYRELRRPMERDSLHRFLWRRAGVSHRMLINQVRLAEELGVTRSLMAGAIKAMEAEGRVRRLRRAQKAFMYQIADPTQWRLDDPDTHARVHTTIQWG